MYCYGLSGGSNVPSPANTTPLLHTSSAYSSLTCKSMSSEESYCRIDMYAKSDQSITLTAEDHYGDDIISVAADGTTSACQVTGNLGTDTMSAISVGDIARVSENTNEMTCHILAISAVTAGTNSPI